MNPDERLRDEIAMRAMEGIIAKLPHHRISVAVGEDSQAAAQKHRARVALSAYRYADAMLEARTAPGVKS